MTAPNSAERKACWDARDLLWKCLDDNNDQAASCQNFQSEFEAKCPAQWVKYPPFFFKLVASVRSGVCIRYNDVRKEEVGAMNNASKSLIVCEIGSKL